MTTESPSSNRRDWLAQALGLLWTIVYSAIGTLIILMICKFTTGLRVSEAEEAAGLDTSLHGEALEH